MNLGSKQLQFIGWGKRSNLVGEKPQLCWACLHGSLEGVVVAGDVRHDLTLVRLLVS